MIKSLRFGMKMISGTVFSLILLTKSIQSQSIEAHRTENDIEIDGKLDESAWENAQSFEEFYQFEPEYGEKASFETRLKVMYDHHTIYFGFECTDPEHARITAKVTKRDGNLPKDDGVVIILDTFFDRNNGYLFSVNPLGTQRDGRIVDNGRIIDFKWDETWYSACRIHEGGWTAVEGFQSVWGFSCLVDQRILFDTGEVPEPLFQNIDRLKVDSDGIEAAAISHDHWDHTGGLWELLKKRRGLRVYACPGFSHTFKNKVNQLQGTLIEAESFLEIDQTIFVTGEIPGEYKGPYIPEQALVVKTESGIRVITGCSHPGIVTMVQKVKEIFPQQYISAVLGGFHLMDKDTQTIESIVTSTKDLGVKKVGPTHCTGHEAQRIFQKDYGNHFLSIAAGRTVEV